MKIKTISWQIVQDFISRPDIVYVFFKIFILYMMNPNHKSKPNTKNQTKNPIIPIPKAMIVIVIITPPISQEFSIWFWFDIFPISTFQILYEKYSGMIIPQLFVLFLLMMLTMSILMNSKHKKYQKYHYGYNRGNDSSYNNNAADLVS